MTTREKLNLAIADTKDILNDLNIEYGPIGNVDINFKHLNRWGQCSYSRYGQVYNIEISSDLLMDGVEWEALLNTLVHEFLHAHRNRMCHTGEWKRCAELVNRNYPTLNIKRCTSSVEKGLADYRNEIRAQKAKYVITCDKCGITNLYKKRSKVVDLIMSQPKNNPTCRCGACKSNYFTVKVN